MRDSAAKNMGKQFDEAIQFGALYKALKKCCRGVRWKPSTAGYEHYALANTYRLRQELLHGSYKLSSYQRFTIREPKVRDHYRCWKANAQRGNTRNLLKQMDRTYTDIMKEEPP